MADVASAVLHNVGNVLNSVNVAAGVLEDTVRRSKAVGVAKLAALVAQPELDALLSAHPKAKHVRPYLDGLGVSLSREQATLLKEIEGLQQNLAHIKAIVAAQQAHAGRGAAIREDVALASLVEDALALDGLHRTIPGLRVKRELASVPAVRVDRHLVFQIVVNLLNNARHAVRGNGREEGTITVRVWQTEAQVCLAVQDDGYGIAPEDLARVFHHGFTTKVEGHGFGLHSSANAAREMGGQLTCASDGRDRGATFVLELPAATARAAA